ncbi:MAG TPA: polysaccharide biosynthesis/export family protein [Terracidiphilus sp.]|nr:polysaccharide biosynthesis/export family protein [Terracidiphilus sp.]
MHNPMVRRQHSIVKAAAVGIVSGAFALAYLPAAGAQNNQQNTTPNSVPTVTLRPQNNPTSQTPLMTVPEDFAALKLSPGFLLNVQVYDEPDLSAHVRVDKDGNVNLPFLKTIHIGGDTVAQAREKIETKFRNDGILKNPQITIEVEQFATTSVTVMGEVQNPGKVELLAPHNLLDVIGMTGGVTTLAGNEIEVKRPVNGNMESTTYHYSRNGDLSAIRDVMVNPGETVIVKRAGIVYVLGGVNRPGGYTMQESGELDVIQAVSLAQGLLMQARVGGLRVVKHLEDGKMVEIPVSYNNIMDGKEKPIQLAAGDIVYVPVSKTKAVFSATTGLLGQVAAASIYVAKPF